MPTLVAVDHDPFADDVAPVSEAGRAPLRITIGGRELNAVPVDHDPFANDTPAPAGLTANALAGVNESIAGIAGAPADLAQGAVNMGARAVNAIAGTNIPTETQSPLGSASIRRGMGAVGIPTDAIQPVTTAEKLARGAGQGIGGAIVTGPAAALIRAGVGPLSRAIGPIMETMIPRTAGQVASDAAIGAVAGAAGRVAEEVAPEPLKPVANLIGNIAGGVGAATVAAAPAAVRAGVRQAADYVAPLSTQGQQRLAGETLRDAASDPRAALRALNDGAQEIVPGSRPTTFQQTGDMGLGALERGVAADRPDDFMTRRADQNIARRDALDQVQPKAAPEAVSRALNDRLAQITRESDDAVQRSISAAAERARAVGGSGNPEEYGASIRGALQEAKRAADAHERALWGAVDPDGTLALPMPATRQAAKNTLKEMPDLARPQSGEEAGIFADVLRYAKADDQVAPFRELTALRSRLSDALREERTTKGETQTYRRLSILRGAVEDDIEGAVTNIAARQADAVASGAMREEDTLLAVVRGWTEKWRGERTAQPEMGQSVADGFGGNASGGSRPVHSTFGAEGSRGRRSAEAPRDQGIPGTQPLAANFDEGAADRLKAASAATRAGKETFDRSAVGPVLARPMATGPYNVPDSVVGQRFFIPGPNGFSRVQELRRAAGDGKALADLESYAAHALRNIAEMPDGTLDPAKVAAWRRKHADALRAFPALDRRLGDARTASETARRVVEAGKTRIDAEQRGALGALLKVEDPDSVVRTVGSLFGRRDSADVMRELASRVGSNAPAREGLRKAVVEHINAWFVSNTEAATSGQSLLKSDQFQTFVRSNKAALRHVFSSDEVKVLGDIAADLSRSNRSMIAVKLPGGSNTAQDLAAMRKAGQEVSILSQIVGSGGGAAAGATLAGPIGAIAGVVGAASLNHFRNAGLRTVGDLIADAMLNPERARVLLSRVTPAKAKAPSMARRIGEVYRQAILVPGTAIAITGASEPDLRKRLKVLAGQMNSADPQTRPTIAAERRAVEREIDRHVADREQGVHEAATSPQNRLPEPTRAQKEAGNYKLGHLSLGGLDISIENPQGSERKGVDANGKPWSVQMKSHYGYIKGTVGKDKDHIDVFVRPETASLPDNAPVFIIDQRNPATGRFDEHKVMLGYGTVEQAGRAYRANYARDWKGLGAITRMSLAEFKNWLRDGDTSKPIASAR